MSTFASTLQSPRFQRRVFVLALVVLVAGVVAFVVTRLGDENAKRDVGAVTAPSGPVKDVSKVPKTVKLQPAAQQVAKLFIQTAVARKDLKKAYPLAGPAIRQGQSLKSWLTGDIAVVPYPIQDLDIAPMKVDFSYANEAMIQVALLPKKGAKVKAQLFSMTLERIGKPKHWVVNAWVPRSEPPVPCGAVNC
ncbi:MAG TPA: hypothetical protein VFI37_15230 [Gaiellaceae bacterium]|jgi:hypothetical protein|nr:hypothetical protein [Gaiellaceae bacterium]